MSNMSYCRFENTVRDLNDCLEALRRVASGEEFLSKEELAKAKELVQICSEFVMDIVEQSGIEDDLQESISMGCFEDVINDTLDTINDDAKEMVEDEDEDEDFDDE